MSNPQDWQRWYRLEPDDRSKPQIGALVGMLAYARMTTLDAVRGLTAAQLDATPPGFTNSVGTLLAHVVAVERLYQALSFESRWPLNDESFRPYLGGLSMGKEGELVTGRPLDWYLRELEEARALTLAALAQRDDAWLAARMQVPDFGYADHHWAWFHVMEDEVSHRGQMRLIRKIVAPRQKAGGQA